MDDVLAASGDDEDDRGSVSARSASMDPPPSTQPRARRGGSPLVTKHVANAKQRALASVESTQTGSSGSSISTRKSSRIRSKKSNGTLALDPKGKLKATLDAPPTDNDAIAQPVASPTGALVANDAALGSVFAPLSGRRTFGAVIPSDPSDKEVYVEDLEYIKFVTLPETCGVTFPLLQDEHLKDTYSDRPNLP